MGRLASDHKTYWSRIRRQIAWNFQILIVSAVKICKKCLQTASAFSRCLTKASPLDPVAPDSQGYSSANENSWQHRWRYCISSYSNALVPALSDRWFTDRNPNQQCCNGLAHPEVRKMQFSVRFLPNPISTINSRIHFDNGWIYYHLKSLEIMLWNMNEDKTN